MRIPELAPDQVAKLIRQYLRETSPDTRKRVIPLIKAELAEYSDEQN